MSKWPLISILIPCYDTPHVLLNKLTGSLKTSDYKGRLEIVLVEIVSHVPLATKRVFVPQRIGYGEAANRGIKKARGEFILLSNPDVIFEKSMVRILVDYITVHGEVGVIGPKVFSMDNPAHISGFDLPVRSLATLTGTLKPIIPNGRQPFEVAWVSGSIILFKKSVWERIGGFDERFFLYWEDADFCMRAGKAGFKTMVVPEARSWHKGSASVGSDNPEKVYYLARNGLYFLRWHASTIAYFVQLIRTLLLCGIKILKIIGPGRRINRAFLLGVLDFFMGRIGRCPHTIT